MAERSFCGAASPCGAADEQAPKSAMRVSPIIMVLIWFLPWIIPDHFSSS
jgi:hypothetical protein